MNRTERSAKQPFAAIRSSRLAFGLLFLLTLTALISLPPAALAARGHVFGFAFAAPGSGNGQLSQPAGLAVNEATHDLYVADRGNDRIERFSSTGSYLGRFDGSGVWESAGTVHTEAPAPSGALENPSTIAVDNACAEHSPPLTELTTPTCAEFDPSAGDVYVQDGFPHFTIYKFSPEGRFIGQIAIPEVGPAHILYGVAVDPAGRLWAYEEQTISHIGFDRFDDKLANEFEAFVPSRVSGQDSLFGLALDSQGDFYAAQAFEQPVYEVIAKLDPEGNAVSKALDEETSSGVAIEARSDDAYLNNLSSFARFAPDGSLLERLGSGHLPSRAEVEAEVGNPAFLGEYRAGIAVDASTASGAGTVYVADGVHGQIQAYPPEPPGPPTIQAASVSAVSATSATLEAEINPRSEPGEAPTEYRFEYGPCASASTCASSPYELSVPVPAGILPASYEVDPVSEHVQSLLPHTVYHARISATNSRSLQPTLGSERTFTTQAFAPFALPDSRAWELVSPPEKHGALIDNTLSTGAVIEAAANGDALTYLATNPTETEPEGAGSSVQLVSGRSAGGWSSLDVSAAHSGAIGQPVGSGQEYRFFSEDLSRGLLQPFGAFEPSLSPEATEQTPYLRTDFPPGQPSALCTVACYRPLLTAAEGLADVPPGVKFGEEGKCPPQTACGPRVVGATGDLAHVVLESLVGLTSYPGDKGGLYEFSAAAPAAEALRLISVLPNGKPAPGGVLPNGDWAGGTFGNRTGGAAREAISNDGSRVVMTLAGRLYLRYNTTHEQSQLAAGQCTEPEAACTIQLDAAEAGCGTCTGGGGEFQLASADGSRIFFTDVNRLTADAGGAEGKPDLYECRIVEVEGRQHCELADLTPASGGESAAVQGAVIGASRDASSLYFVADGVLSHNTVENGGGPEEAQPGTCAGESSPPAATCNLYLHRGGSTRFIATLSGRDSHNWALDGVSLGDLAARVSPNGRWLAFMSQRSLTGYDNRDAASGVPDQEVFLYDAGEAEAEARLACASCNPTGARPDGVQVSGREEKAFGATRWGGTWVAAEIPGWTPYRQSAWRYQPRYLSDAGRLFFTSADALVPQDTNGTQDVYEYEPPQAEGAPPHDSCTEAATAYAPASSGCIALISSGTSPRESAFLDASESGNDVFFLTASRLASGDRDTSYDVYDARVEGGFPEAPKSVECQGDACQHPATPPEELTPGSLTYQGPGNEHPSPPARKPCPKGTRKVKSRGKVVCRRPKHSHRRRAGRNHGGHR